MSDQDATAREALDSAIAIVGMTGRFPGARSIEELWQNLRDGVESITVFSNEELLASGEDPALLSDPSYVPARGVLDEIELFDASFFGYAPREAEVTDPQQRLFLECAWEALERAGYDPETYDGRIGVYAGSSMSSYLLSNLVANPRRMSSLGGLQLLITNDKDYLTTRVSYKLNLRGPSVSVNTACSTSLVAVHLACQSLLNGECDMALAGGSTVMIPHRAGYLYREGGIGSPDGHCRAFDARAQGMVDGNGVAIVVLKRLEDALADRDHIYAVIKGSAINNDGSLKVGYTAPSVEGQAQVITEALAMAGIEAKTISYVETHGTATPLGDPIEVAALTQAFRASTQAQGFCAIGSVKTNIGHTDTVAGVAGLIKTALALEHRMIPPSLHYERPNPEIDFANSPFFVNATLAEWKTTGIPRRAGVSSFGVGGTNAHVVLEETPRVEPSGLSRPWQLLVLSAKTGWALESATANLLSYLKQHPAVNLADVAYTYQVGRRGFNHRRMLVCRDLDDAIGALDARDPERILTTRHESREQQIVFMFPGGGAQFGNMGAELYQVEGVFREQVDRCAALLEPHLGLDLRTVLYPSGSASAVAAPELVQPALALPALFVTEYALAQLWMAWGVRPKAMIGHSLGEYVAACLAGVISLKDALALVALRGHLFEDLPQGGMLSVPLSEQEVQPYLGGQLAVAAINGPSLCVVSGPADAIDALQQVLTGKGLEGRRLPIAVAGHSPVVEPILRPFARFIEKVPRHAPQIPFISNVTGTWITAAEATDPAYWARHLRQTVRFAAGLHELLRGPNRVLLEVGPGQTLSTLARQHPDRRAGQVIIPSMRHPHAHEPDERALLGALGKLWLAGVPINWAAFSAHERRRRLPLPTYPFERQRYWIEPEVREQKVGRCQEQIDEEPVAVEPAGEAAASLHPRPTLLNAYVAPHDETQQQIVALWQGLLGIDQIGVHDDFFELGGHSLLATQLVVQLRERFRVDLPLRAVLEAPTVAKLASSIEAVRRAEPAALSRSPLVAIQPSGSKRPFFCVHPVGGNVLCYADLARHLGPDQPFYGLEAPGLSDEREPCARIEEMASQYIDMLRALQPQGPYLLGGWSLGGVVAFEMAQRLRQQSARVALLALVDPPLPTGDAHFADDDALMVSWFARDLSGGRAERLLVSAADLGQLEPDEQLRHILDQAIAAHLLSPDEGLPRIRQLFHVFTTHMRALLSYVPEAYPGHMVLFKASEPLAEGDRDPTAGWGTLATGGIEVHTIPGNHYTMVGEPHVRLLAERLRACLDGVAVVSHEGGHAW